MQAEKKKELTKQIIIRVKEVIEDLSDKEVIERMEAAGEQTSIATIRRIRAQGSEDTGFNYDLTVKPFAKVFLDLSDKPVEVAASASKEEKDRAALDNLLQLKNVQIKTLEDQLDKEQKITAYLKEQVNFRGGQIISKDDQIKSKDIQLAERAEYLRLKDAEIAELKKGIAELKEENTELKKELKGRTRANKLLVVVAIVSLFLAAVLPPILPLL